MSNLTPFIVFSCFIALIMGINYAYFVSIKRKISEFMEASGCSQIEFPAGFWSAMKNQLIMHPVEYVDRSGSVRKNRCVYIRMPFNEGGFFWEEPLNL